MADQPALPSAPPARVVSFARNLSAVMGTAEVGVDTPLTTTGIPRGAGCSYGDQSLSAGGVAWRAPDTLRVDGDTVVAGGGAALRDVLARLWPQGRTLPVVPGSLSVTVGGAIAADVHGKNHPHVGAFGGHVTELVLRSPSGPHRLSPEDPAFRATVGGMGLTGVIVEARLCTVPLATGWVRQVVVTVGGAADLLDTLAAMSDDHEHVAAWVHLLGGEIRGVVEASDPGAPVPDGQPAFPVPRTPVMTVPPVPVRLVRAATMRLFNEVRWRRTTSGVDTIPLAGALAPLEAVDDFPRAYGRRGLVQHQVLVPDGHRDLLVDLLDRHRSAPGMPALVVVKRLGRPGTGHLSFPGPGWTLAVDHPADDPALASVLDAMDRDVADVGGRVYLAKDATMRPSRVHAMYPRLGEWRAIADGLDPDHLVTSDLDRRLGLRRPTGPRHDPTPQEQAHA